MLKLSQETIDQEEELIRQSISQLSDNERKEYFHTVKSQIKDPDTYAVLNWFFMAGLHHFYLGYRLRGCVHLSIFIVGLALIFAGLESLGILIIVGISIVELYALFQSQLIVQNYNNQLMQKALDELRKFKTK